MSAPVFVATGRIYRGCGPLPLSRANLCGLRSCAAIAVVAILASGCSFSYQLGSMIGKGEGDAKPSLAAAAPAGAAPAEDDLIHARAAVADALAKGGTTRSTPWENPATGARGTVTPTSTASSQEGGFVCRDFLASYVRGGNETWLEGEACRVHRGRWEVRRLTPWRQT
jgi:surface antigen